jgi:hypothetical protein
MLAEFAALVIFVPWVVSKTTCSTSPDTLGDTAWSKWSASVDCVLGNENVFE